MQKLNNIHLCTKLQQTERNKGTRKPTKKIVTHQRFCLRNKETIVITGNIFSIRSLGLKDKTTKKK